MTDNEAGQYWDGNAVAWTTLARAGFDTYRDHLNTPAFFGMLPNIKGLSGIDIGCGEGYNTRLLVQRGADLKAVDISEKFIKSAENAERDAPLGIEYVVSGAANLPFPDEYFDFATSFMCLMDIPDLDKALQEAHRVLKPNGFLQFSITHPCYNTPHRKNLRNAAGKTYAIEVGDYFKQLHGKIDEWIFGNLPAELKNRFSKFKAPIFNKTLTQWFASISAAGFIIEKINEPWPDNETVSKHPSLQDAQTVAYFLHIRGRKQN